MGNSRLGHNSQQMTAKTHRPAPDSLLALVVAIKRIVAIRLEAIALAQRPPVQDQYAGGTSLCLLAPKAGEIGRDLWGPAEENGALSRVQME